MRIPPYWARARYDGKDPQGRGLEFTGVGWSFDSLQDARYKVCELIQEIGPPARHEEPRMIIGIHDRETGVARQAELA